MNSIRKRQDGTITGMSDSLILPLVLVVNKRGRTAESNYYGLPARLQLVEPSHD